MMADHLEAPALSLNRDRMGSCLNAASLRRILLSPSPLPWPRRSGRDARHVVSLYLYGANPLQAYFALFHEPFATLRGFGYALVRAAPLR